MQPAPFSAREPNLALGGQDRAELRAGGPRGPKAGIALGTG